MFNFNVDFSKSKEQKTEFDFSELSSNLGLETLFDGGEIEKEMQALSRDISNTESASGGFSLDNIVAGFDQIEGDDSLNFFADADNPELSFGKPGFAKPQNDYYDSLNWDE